MIIETETLSKAAALMRQRAEAAPQGKWSAWRNQVGVPNLVNMRDRPATFAVPHVSRYVVGHTDEEPSDVVVGGMTEHIASWHPAVALAVAAWLDEEARWLSVTKLQRRITTDHALAVARTYLGENQ